MDVIEVDYGENDMKNEMGEFIIHLPLSDRSGAPAFP